MHGLESESSEAATARVIYIYLCKLAFVVERSNGEGCNRNF